LENEETEEKEGNEVKKNGRGGLQEGCTEGWRKG
jgi:hypothetical protein